MIIGLFYFADLELNIVKIEGRSMQLLHVCERASSTPLHLTAISILIVVAHGSFHRVLRTRFFLCSGCCIVLLFSFKWHYTIIIAVNISTNNIVIILIMARTYQLRLLMRRVFFSCFALLAYCTFTVDVTLIRLAQLFPDVSKSLTVQ